MLIVFQMFKNHISRYAQGNKYPTTFYIFFMEFHNAQVDMATWHPLISNFRYCAVG